MADNSRTVMTDAGFALEAKVRADETKMQFTRATISTDDHFDDADDALAKLGTLDNVQQDGAITDVKVIDDTTVHVQVDVDQTKAPADYAMLSAGLYARDGDDNEILYGVIVLKDPAYVHKDDDGSYLGFGIDTVVGRAANVTIAVSPANVVTQQAFSSVMADYYDKTAVENLLKNYVTDDDFASKLPKNIATTDAANTFAKSQTLAGGATDGKGNAYATTKDVATGLNNGLSTKVTDNKNGTEQLNGVQVQPFNKLSDTIGGRNLLLGTSSTKVWNSTWRNIINVDITNLVGKTLTYSAILDITECKQGTAAVSLVPQDSSGKSIGDMVQSNSINFGNVGKVIATITIPAGASNLSIIEQTNNTNLNPQVGSRKLEQGSIATDWSPAPEDKVNATDTANWQKNKVTNDDGGNKYSFTTANTTDLVASIQTLPLGYHTFYCQSGVQGNPSSQSVRGIANITTAGAKPLGVGYLTDSTGAFWSFYVDSSGFKLKQSADDIKVVHSTDMRKPASDVAGIEEVNAKQDKIGYTPADDSKVVHNSAIDPSVLLGAIPITSTTDLFTLDPGIYFGNNATPVNGPATNSLPTTNYFWVKLETPKANALIKKLTWTDNGNHQYVNEYYGLSAKWHDWQVLNSTTMASKSDVSAAVGTATANMVDRNPDTGVVSEPTDFTNLTVNGGKSVATSDDLKSLEASAWRPLTLKNSSSGIILFKDNGNGTASLTGSANFTVAKGTKTLTPAITPPTGYIFTSLNWNERSYNNNGVWANKYMGSGSSGVLDSFDTIISNGVICFLGQDDNDKPITFSPSELTTVNNSTDCNPALVSISKV